MFTFADDTVQNQLVVATVPFMANIFRCTRPHRWLTTDVVKNCIINLFIFFVDYSFLRGIDGWPVDRGS